jgi:lipoyl-dependent peroxiredoxin
MQRKASARWQGNLKAGRGTVTTGSRALEDAAYSFTTRFQNEIGTNPEELIAAAHAACFSMALAHELESRDAKPEVIETTANLELEQKDKSWTVTRIHLQTRAKVPGVEQDVFQLAAKTAKENCPISRLLKTEITMEAMVTA